MVQEVLNWTCVGVFVATSIITILGIIRKIDIAKEYLNKLFLVLVVEIVGIVLVSFKGDLSPNSGISASVKNVKSDPSTDSWIAFNRTSGKALEAINLLQDTVACGVLQPNAKNLDLTLTMNAEHQISIENGITLGKINSSSVNAFCSSKCDYAKTAPLSPILDANFTPQYLVNPFSMNFGFCIKVPGTLYFKIKNSSGVEATYEKQDGNLIQPKQTKTFALDNQKYFISCVDYDNQLGTSTFVVGTL